MSKYKPRYNMDSYKDTYEDTTSLPKVRIAVYEEDGDIKFVLPGNRVVSYGKMDINKAKKQIADKVRNEGGIIEWREVDEDFKDAMREEVNKRQQKHPTTKLFSLVSEMVKVADLMDREGVVDKADKLDDMVLKILNYN